MRDQAVKFLYDRINYERYASTPYGERAFKLDRMRQLLERLGNPQLRLPTIHVAGTKGKGSTGRILASILQSAGFRVGHFSSPHLERLEERFQIDGLPCSERSFVETVERIRPACEAMDRESGEMSPTFFEATTALAWEYFLAEKADFAVMEVGMGGRLDSTNVCDPILTIIASIGLDHTEQLGDTLEAIAGEKAGIIKPGVPMISGVEAEGPAAVIERICRENNAPLIRRGVDFSVRSASSDENAFDFLASSERIVLEPLRDLRLNLLGKHQRDNAAIAITAAEMIRRSGRRIPDEAFRRGLSSVHCPGCVEHVSRNPDVILDGAHNEISVLALLDALRTHFSQSRGERRLLFACAEDKKPETLLRLLLPWFGSVTFTKFTTSPRASRPEKLASLAGAVTGLAYPVFDDPAQAFAELRRTSAPGDLLCVAGSIYLAGEIRATLQSEKT